MNIQKRIPLEPPPMKPSRLGFPHGGELFLTEKELAVWLRVSPRSVQRWRDTDEGPPWRRHGYRVCYSVREALNWSEATKNQITPRRGVVITARSATPYGGPRG
jgi:hypothetical protein